MNLSKYSSHPFFWFLVGILFIVVAFIVVESMSTASDRLENANRYYQTGIEAKTIASRQDAFNASLAIYQDLNKEYNPTSGNGKLFFNIANNYFQLGNYPLALLYYERAKYFMPNDPLTETNIRVTKEKLGLKEGIKSESYIHKLFFLQNRFSIPEELQIFSLLSFLFFLFTSLFIWFKTPILKPFIALLITLLLLTFANLFYGQFILPSSALALKSSFLYMDAGSQYAKVQNDPLPPGTKVTVLKAVLGGRWLKIETEDGIVGYLPGEAAEII